MLLFATKFIYRALSVVESKKAATFAVAESSKMQTSNGWKAAHDFVFPDDLPKHRRVGNETHDVFLFRDRIKAIWDAVIDEEYLDSRWPSYSTKNSPRWDEIKALATKQRELFEIACSKHKEIQKAKKLARKPKRRKLERKPKGAMKDGIEDEQNRDHNQDEGGAEEAKMTDPDQAGGDPVLASGMATVGEAKNDDAPRTDNTENMDEGAQLEGSPNPKGTADMEEPKNGDNAPEPQQTADLHEQNKTENAPVGTQSLSEAQRNGYEIQDYKSAYFEVKSTFWRWVRFFCANYSSSDLSHKVC